METDARIIQTAQYAYQIQADAQRQLADEMMRPFVVLKPRIFMDGNQWCVLHGENLQDGVAGFGDSPFEASVDFDKNWHTKIGATQ